MSVIIVGGGMIGATLALAISHLSKGQLPVHLVEAVAPQAKIIPVLIPALLPWRRVPASSCPVLASGRPSPIARRQLKPFT